MSPQKNHLGNLKKIKICNWSLVAHACNPSYLGGWDREDQVSMPARQKVSKTISTEKKLGVVAYTCHPSNL
jgi:hypothetical protein